MDDIKVVGLASSKSKGKTNWKVISAIIGIVVLSIGVIAGIFLVRQQQDVREKASGNCDDPSSIVQCPAANGNLYSCTPPDSSGNAQISVCDNRFMGRVEACGGAQYCCNGTSWVTDMSSCSCDASAPTALTTTNLTSTSVTLKWTAGTGGKYRLWVSKNADPMTCSSDSANCIANDVSITPTTTTEYALTNLTPNTKYYWRIMAWTASGCDSGSTVMNFTTTAAGSSSAPSKPTVATSCTNNSPQATISWTGTPASDFGFYVDISKTSDFSVFYNKKVTSGSSTDTSNFRKFLGENVDNSQAELLLISKDTTYYTRVFNGLTSDTSVAWLVSCASATTTPTATSTSASKTATPTMTATSKATATSTSSGSKTATPTVKPTSTGSGTAFPVPETGADLPTMLGVSFGIVMVLASLGLAL